jgi:hypothetical protein
MHDTIRRLFDAAVTYTRERLGTTPTLLRLALVLAQVILMIIVLRELDMLTVAFRRVLYVAAAGFIVHHVLPDSLRLPFFVLLSIGATALVLGGSIWDEILWDPAVALPHTGVVVAISVIVIIICALPIGFWKRTGLLLAGSALAVLARSGGLGDLGMAALWPVVGTVFMFRTIIYLYDVSTSNQRVSWTQSLAYFLLLPNAAALLFPVIDFKTMFRSRYDQPPLAIYERGAGWMGRGVLQLLLYRFIDQVALIKPSAVADGADLIRFLLANSLAYLHVSGQFHLIVGVLLLFGFNLPETNHRYFLASSFTDYWRRVNIYWKDFMVKVFYYPTFFHLKGYGPTVAMIVATLWVFFVTWVLHLYQRWWLKGSISVTWPDTLFWSILGILVLANSLWELRRGRQRRLTSSVPSVASAAGLAARTAGTFACICLLWSLWSTPTLTLWLGLWRHADWRTLIGGVAALLVIMLAKIGVDVLPARRSTRAAPGGRTFPPAILWRSPVLYAAPLLGVLVLVQPSVRPHVESPLVRQLVQKFGLPPHYVDRVFEVLETGESITASSGAAELAYYQQLTSVDDGNRELAGTLLGRPMVVAHKGYSPTARTHDFRLFELLPSVHVQAYETDVQTNRWGMRDREYELTKPPGTIRIALMGSSHVMGWAVRQDEIFETLLETRLNRELCADELCRFEILNFAAFGYSPLSYLSLVRGRVREFEPDLVLVIGHTMDPSFVNQTLRSVLQRGDPITDDYLQQMLRDARVLAHLRDGLAEKRLRPFEPALTAWSYERIAAESRSMGAEPVFAFVPIPNRDLPLTAARLRNIRELTTAAATAGHIVIDLAHVYDGHAANELQTGISIHTNARGHALIADALYRRLVAEARIDLARRAHSAASVASQSRVGRKHSQ